MKNKLLLLVFILASLTVFAQNPTYECRVKNGEQTSDKTFEFDIFIKRTGSVPLELANAQFGITYDPSIINGGTLTFSILAGSSTLSNTAQVPTSVSASTASPKYVLRVAPRANPGAGAGSIISEVGDGTKIGRFKLANTVPFSAANLNLAWSFTTTQYNTIVSAYVATLATNVTVQSSHFINLGTNPVITWQNTLSVTDAGAQTGSLVFGQAPTATDGIDVTLGEAALSAPPAAGTFDARFVLPVVPEVASVKDYRADTLRTAIYKVNFQPSASGYPFTFKWNKSALPVGYFTLRDQSGSIMVNMKSDSQYVLTNSAITSLQIVYKKDFCADVTVNTGWNLISVPAVVSNFTGSVVYPNVNSPFFAFANGYNSVTTLANGVGYWARFDTNRTVQVCGTPVTATTIPVLAGWNLVGLYDYNVNVASVTTTPAGIINSNFFGFTPVSGYSVPTVLNGGKGYWVRVSQNGTINLATTTAKASNPVYNTEIKSDWVKISVIDNNGIRRSLYMAKNGSDFSNYELPPAPPVGIADVRFGNDRTVALLNSVQEIKLQSLDYPVTVQIDGADLQIQDNVNGKLLNKNLHSGQAVTINDPALNVLVIKGLAAPTEFALAQNYPNPFNPETAIEYQLPENAMVSLEVFSVTGEKVATIVNEMQSAGYYKYAFSAQSGNKTLASGLYICRLVANSNTAKNFVSVKKMVLMK